MKTIVFILFTVLSLFFSFQSKAQNLHLISDVHIFLEPTTPHAIDTMMLMDTTNTITNYTGFDDTEEFKFSVSVLLLDTVEISKIYVKAGRTQGGNDLLESYFEYDNNTPANGISYSRHLKQMDLGIGNFINLRNIYTEVYIENTSGVTTQLVLNHINQ